jgi:hypothetical protein
LWAEEARGLYIKLILIKQTLFRWIAAVDSILPSEHSSTVAPRVLQRNSGQIVLFPEAWPCFSEEYLGVLIHKKAVTKENGAWSRWSWGRPDTVMLDAPPSR